MKIEMECTLGLPRKIVWKYLKDADILKQSLPGCQEFTEISPALYEGKFEINVGPIQDVFALEVRRLKEKASSYFLLGIKGKGKLGEIDAKVDLNLHDIDGSTKISLHTDANISGAVGIVGDGIKENAAKKSLQKFFEGIEKEMKRGIYKKRKDH